MDLSLSKETWMFGAFALVIIIMLVLDLGFFRVQARKISNRETLAWSIVWITLALAFGGFIYWCEGVTKATEYVTAYLIEEALSVDNLFVFILIFSFFQVPAKYQHKVLFWGIIGAVIFRAIFIFSGVWLINLTFLPVILLFGRPVQINVILTLFGFFLVYAGVQSLKADGEEEKDFSNSLGVKIVRNLMPVTGKYDGGNFFTWQNGKRMATLLLVVAAVLEITDLIFAVDSIPAIFSVSKDPFILYTSNIFAILGLRTLYFLLANTHQLFVYLKYGLAFILSFIGFKMVCSPFIYISTSLSLAIVAGVLFISVITSLVVKKA